MSLKNFLAGAILYSTIEMIWRGRTHWTMAVLGGIVYMILNSISIRAQGMSIAVKSIIGSGVITLLEFLVGLVLNVKMGLKIWNYENIGYNILGQICPKYTVYWFMLCVVAFIIIGIRNRVITIYTSKKEQTLRSS